MMPEGFNISQWLQGIGMGEYIEIFEENHINLGTLAELSDADLKELGIASLGHRKLLLGEIQRLLKEGFAEAGTAPEAALPEVATVRTPKSEPFIPTPTALASQSESPSAEGQKSAAANAVEAANSSSQSQKDKPARKSLWTRILASKFLVGSIAAHLLFGIGATFFIVQRYSEKRKVTFAGGPPSTTASTRALEHKVSMAQKKKTGGAPPQAKRVVSTGLGGLSLPDLPNTTTANTIVPGMAAGMGGAGMGMGMGFGNGMGSGMGGGGGGGGGGMTMFGFRGAGAGLVGTFYDFKQTRDRKPTKMASPPGEAVVIHNPQNDEYIATLKRFIKNWNPDSLSNFYRSNTQLSAAQIFIPTISAAEAPKAFSVEKECEGRRWIVHYKGEIIAPRSGRFRFVGICDDIIVVRCNMHNVLDGSLGFYRLDPGANESEQEGLSIGKWIQMTVGEVLKLEVIIGECPGGNFTSFLMMEEEAAKPAGTHSVFQLRQMDVPNGANVTHSGTIVFGSRAPLNPFSSPTLR